jgi:crotonobetainyl-CoA:carnitine CoA-transferase CaiB-like acyl-CoA transferase
VESLEGKESRTWKPPAFNDESTYLRSVNRNKSSVTLALGTQQSRESPCAGETRRCLRPQLQTSSIDTFGLGYEHIREITETASISTTLPGRAMAAGVAERRMVG